MIGIDPASIVPLSSNPDVTDAPARFAAIAADWIDVPRHGGEYDGGHPCGVQQDGALAAETARRIARFYDQPLCAYERMGEVVRGSSDDGRMLAPKASSPQRAA